MKITLSLIIVQIIAIADIFIEKILQDWTKTHYNALPMLCYHVLVYIIFGILAALALSEWKNVSAQAKKVTLICGIINVCAICYFWFGRYSLADMILLLVGVYAYLGISEIKKRIR